MIHFDKFTRENMREISEILQKHLNEASKEVGVEFTMSGGSFLDSSATLKVKCKLLTEGGAIATSEFEYERADNRARTNGVNFKSPHFVGSVWENSSLGMFRVDDINTRNRRYPVLLTTKDGGKRKASYITFRSATEVLPPSMDDFKTWFTIDPEDDRITSKQEETSDRVTAYLDTRYQGNKTYDMFFEVAGAFLEMIAGKVTARHLRVAQQLYGLVIGVEDNDLKKAIEVVNENMD